MHSTRLFSNMVGAKVALMMFISMQVSAQQWWRDDFNGSGSPSSSNWNVDHANGGFGNNELQFYTNRTSNVTQGSNCLQLIARRENYGGNAYTSGKITSYGKRHWGSGFIEARMSIPMGQGLWPAFWMLGVNIGSIGWPACGEIDIMEHVNNDNGIHGTIHWNGPNGYASYGGYRANVGPSGWHNYQINWNNNSIRWYVDGNLYHTANIANNINSTEEFHRDFFLILNLAVGGNWPGSPNSGTPFPSTLWVDYVAVYAPNTSLTGREGIVNEPQTFTSLDNNRSRTFEPTTTSPEEVVSLTAYPSPFTDKLTYTVPEEHATHTFRLFDMTGTPLIVNNVTGKEKAHTIDVSHLASGFYVVRVTNGSFSKSLKVKKQ
jgi:beta-glucanase (GH16 family)